MFFYLFLFLVCRVPPDASSRLPDWALKWLAVGIPMFSTATSMVKPAGVPSVEALALRANSCASGIDALQYGSQEWGECDRHSPLRFGAMMSRAGPRRAASCLT